VTFCRQHQRGSGRHPGDAGRVYRTAERYAVATAICTSSAVQLPVDYRSGRNLVETSLYPAIVATFQPRSTHRAALSPRCRAH
jgi:hypothetical protein